MKAFNVDRKDGNLIVTRPDNCNHPRIYPPVECNAPHPSNPECDCRWCVFNNEYCQAKDNGYDYNIEGKLS